MVYIYISENQSPIGNQTTNQNQVSGEHMSVNSKLKRTIDIMGAIAGLTITGLMFVPVAIAIKLNSKGSVLYSQTRCGYKGRKFRIWIRTGFILTISPFDNLA